MSTPSYDPAREWDNYCEEEERYLANRQVCASCEEPIADDYCYLIGKDYLCEDCMKSEYRVQTPVYDDWEEGDRDD